MDEAIVIGAGLVGTASAYALARRGMQVTLIDRLSGPAEAASFANGGMLTPSMADPWNAPGVWKDLLRWYGRSDAPMLLRNKAIPALAGWGVRFLAASNPDHHRQATGLNVKLARFSLEVMRRWRAGAHLSYDGAQVGTAKIYRTGPALEAGLAKAAALKVFGIEYALLTPDETARLQPALAPICSGLAGAIRFPGDESGDAYKFTRELLRETVPLGVTARWNTEISRIRIRGAAAQGVELADGDFLPARRIILAAGAWSGRLGRQAGLHLAIQPVKGYSMTFSMTGIAPEERLSLPIVDDDLHAAVTPLGDRIRVAGTAEFTGFDTEPDPVRLENLRRILRAVLPGQAATLEKHEIDSWCGFRPMAACGVPAIGPAGMEGLFVNTGHGHLGWTQAAGSAEALAQNICGDAAGFALDAYAPFPLRRG